MSIPDLEIRFETLIHPESLKAIGSIGRGWYSGLSNVLLEEHHHVFGFELSSFFELFF